MCSTLNKIATCERTAGLVHVQMVMVECRDQIHWDMHLRMLVIGVALVTFGTHSWSSLAILLLRTSAIYSGSRRVTVPLWAAYAVRPLDCFFRAV